MKLLANLSRILLGLVFVFSGFVKGVDPMGTAYRIDDYFVAYGMQWAEPMSLALSILLCALEFSTGIYLLLNVRMRLVSWLALGLMVYFTILTFFDALFNMVPDCGCFGDAIKLSNWATFYKNIVLITLAVIVFVYRKRFKSPYGPGLGLAILIGVFVGFAWFSRHSIRHLPPLEFNYWKEGNKMVPDTLKPQQTFVTYRNKTTNEHKEYLSPDYPWQDSVWMKEWEWVSSRIADPNEYKAPNFNIIDTTGNNLTSSYIQQKGYLVFLISPELDKAGKENLAKLNELYETLSGAGFQVLGLTASGNADIRTYIGAQGWSVPFYNSDDKELKTMIRSNPGMVLLKDWVVLKKWHWRDLPEGKWFIDEYGSE